MIVELICEVDCKSMTDNQVMMETVIKNSIPPEGKVVNIGDNFDNRKPNSGYGKVYWDEEESKIMITAVLNWRKKKEDLIGLYISPYYRILKQDSEYIHDAELVAVSICERHTNPDIKPISKKNFIESISEKLSNGWELYGAPTINHHMDNEGQEWNQFSQALIKGKDQTYHIDNKYHQMFGFIISQRKLNFVFLLENMDLSKKEWEEMKQNYDVEFILTEQELEFADKFHKGK